MNTEQVNHEYYVTTTDSDLSITTNKIDSNIDNLIFSSDCYQVNNSELSTNITSINNEENTISLSDQLQTNNQENRCIITNLASIKENILRELTEKFVSQLYFKTQFQNNNNNPFEEFSPDWLKLFIEKQNIDSEKLLEMMLKHNQSNFYFTSFIGYFYQYGIGTEIIKQKSLAYYFQSTNLYFTKKPGDNSLEIINQSIGQYFLAIFYNKGIMVPKDIIMMFEWGIKSAQLGNVFAQLNISSCYYFGYGTDKNKQKAFEWLLTSAENGNNNAQCELQYVIKMEKILKKMIEKHLNGF